MLHNLKPYSKYKDSGVPWLGRVPEHWDVVPNRVILKLKKKIVGTSSAKYTLLSLTKQGVIARDLENPEGKFPASFDTYQEVKAGDLIFCLFDIDETPRTVGLSTLEGMITGAYTIFECADPTAVKFIYLFYLAMDNGKELKPLYTGLRKVITKSTFLSANMPLPPSDEQSAIVHYLDHFDRRIRRYIRTKQKLIKLLEEQKQAIIYQAVTRGLDPNVKLKPSGVEWLGDIPEHWEVLPLKSLSSVQSGITLGKQYIGQKLVKFPYLRVANVQEGHVDLSEIKTIEVPVEEASRSQLQKGDVLMTEGGDPDKLGRGCVWEGQISPCLHQNHIFAVRPNISCLRPYYLGILLSSQYSKEYFLRTAKQTTNLASTNKTTIRQFPIPLPKVEEQDLILDELQKELGGIGQVVSGVYREISLLREYRTSLIANVVTGKLDMREAAVNLPEETDETESFDDVLAENEELESNEIEDEQAGELE